MSPDVRLYELALSIKGQTQLILVELDALRDMMKVFCEMTGLVKDFNNNKISVLDMPASDVLKLAQFIIIVRGLHENGE